MNFDLFESESNKTHEEMQQLAQNDSNLLYFRFQPDITKASADISDSSTRNTQALMDDANAYIASNDTKFDRLFSLMKIRVDQIY